MATAGPKLSDGLKAAVDVANGGPKWLEHQVDAYLANKTDGDRRDPGWFHPSSLHHPCDAYLTFEFLGVRKRVGNVPARTRRIFDNGHGRDRDWKGYLEGAGLSVAHLRPRELCTCGQIWANTMDELREMKTVAPDADIKLWDGRHICLPDLRIRGDFDDLIVDPHDQSREVVIHEFKTKNLALWKKLPRQTRTTSSRRIHTWWRPGRGVRSSIMSARMTRISRCLRSHLTLTPGRR
jgi:hypothetical protein